MTKLFDPRRPLGRLFFCLISVLLAVLVCDAQDAPATTTVADVVYRADSSPASGTLLISWPAFETAEHNSVAAGVLTVKIGEAGAVSIPLVPNFGATPAGTYYKVTYKLDDGTTSEEYWSVPAAPTTTIAAIRSKLVPANVAVQTVSRQYVDSALADVVRTSGNQAISGTKTFSDLHAPEPLSAEDAASKGYVDTAVASAPGGGISPNPPGSQTITQPAGTRFKVTGGKPSEFDDVVAKGPQVDVRAYGCAADGVTDDTACIQAAIDANPGKTILLPKTQAPTEAGGPQYDYVISVPLTISGSSTQWGSAGTCLVGQGNAQAGTSTYIKVNTDVSGIILKSIGSCVRHLRLYNPATAYSDTNPATHTMGTSDGIKVRAGTVALEDVFVEGFSRDGVNLDSTDSANCIGAGCNLNLFRMKWVRADMNRRHGFYTKGSDANAGECEDCDARFNQFLGVADYSNGANKWRGHFDGNHNDTNGRGTAGAVNLSSCSVSNQLATCTTATNHSFIPADWLVFTGGCNSTFGNEVQALTIPAANQFTFRADKANTATCNSGTVGYEATAREWAQSRTVTGNTGAGSPNISVTAGTVSVEDVGAIAAVPGAGPGGTTFSCVIVGVTGSVMGCDRLATTPVTGATITLEKIGGPYFMFASAGTLVAPYSEGNQHGGGRVSSTSNVFGGNNGTGWEYATYPNIIQGGHATPLEFAQLGQAGRYADQSFTPGMGRCAVSDKTDACHNAAFVIKNLDRAAGQVHSSLVMKRTATGAVDGLWKLTTESAGNESGTAFDLSAIAFFDNYTQRGGVLTGASTWFPRGFYLGDRAGGKKELRGGSASWASGTQEAGDILFKTNPAAGSFLGWTCVAAGTPCASAVAFGPVANDGSGTSWSFGAVNLSGQLVSTLATGSAPLTVASTTPVANLTLAADSQLPTISSAGKIAATALPDAQRKRICEVHIGAPTGPALADGDDEPVSCYNDYGASLTITAVRCYADAGSPTVTPILTGGAANSILTGALTCGTGSWAAGTLNGAPVLPAGGTLDANITSAGGTAKYIRLVVTMQ